MIQDTKRVHKESHIAVLPVEWFWSYMDISQIMGLHKETMVQMQSRRNYYPYSLKRE